MMSSAGPRLQLEEVCCREVQKRRTGTVSGMVKRGRSYAGDRDGDLPYRAFPLEFFDQEE